MSEEVHASGLTVVRSGLTIAVPLDVEAQGGDAIELFVAEYVATVQAGTAAPPEPDGESAGQEGTP